MRTLTHNKKHIDMKTKNNCWLGIFATICLSGYSLSCNGQAKIEGTWLEPIPGMENRLQGFKLEDNGKASSVNMATLLYDSWKQDGNHLILSGKSIGNGTTFAFTDTLVVDNLTEDSLILRRGEMTLRYARNGGRKARKNIPMTKLTPAKRNSFITKGTLIFAHETRSFTPEGEDEAYWITDKSGKLAEEYDRLTEGVKSGTPVHAELEVVDMGKSNEGFAKSYKSVYKVVKIRKISKD